MPTPESPLDQTPEPLDRGAEQQIVLEVTSGAEQGRRFEFSRHGNFIVGRAPSAHFRLPKDDRRVSRLHFLIEFNPPHCRLLDLGSRNGTRVNGERVKSADLGHGDTIDAGRTSFRLDASCLTTALAEPPIVQPPVVLPPPPPPAPSPQRPANPVSQATFRPPPRAAALEPTQPWAATPAVAGNALGAPEDASFRSEFPEILGYRLTRKLGEGGMGIVYLATRLADGRQLALKTVRPALAASDRDLRKFVREASILMQLEHPYIVSFREMGKGEDFAYFTMDFIPGYDAARLAERQGPFKIGRVLRIASQFLPALEYAHTAGFVHRDIKPSNLLLSGSGEQETAYLADFGLARVYHDSPLSGLTIMGDVGGTVVYMSPEQVLNFREAKPAADQYAAAATLYYLLTGGLHVHDFDTSAPEKCLLKKLLNTHIPLLERRADVPPNLAAVIDRALAREPKDRFESVQAMRKALP